MDKATRQFEQRDGSAVVGTRVTEAFTLGSFANGAEPAYIRRIQR